MEISKEHLLLTFQNALLYNVCPNTRIIFADIESVNKLITWIYVDLPPTEAEKDMYYSIQSEVLGEFEGFDDSGSKVKILTGHFDEENLRGKMVLFARCDYLDENRNLIK
ncbi:MAG: hypothetical protein R3D00_22835 [Bacteroidia bacterium]